MNTLGMPSTAISAQPTPNADADIRIVVGQDFHVPPLLTTLMLDADHQAVSCTTSGWCRLRRHSVTGLPSRRVR